MTASEGTMKVRVSAIAQETSDISVLELRAVDGELPRFSAGSHIDLHLANGLIRSYSLTNAPSETHRYVIGVKKEPLGRGGSRFIHEQLRPGDETTISPPRSNFKLCEHAPSSVLIAGGIGITPLKCMAQHLEDLGKPWQLHYAARSRCSAAFVSQLAEFGPKVRFYFPTEFNRAPSASRIDINAVIAEAPADAHLYCCGPEAMLEAFKTASADRSPAQTHVEYFANAQAADKTGEFEVVLAKSGRTVGVPSGKSILDALLELGIDAPFSCMEGVCSSCETRVLSGIPDHRDLILTSEEHAANDRMMICCSRSKSRTLVLEL
jgi:vanillate O-demethylase ferredoxin subunit